jgi:hypothetical protein
MQVLDVCTVALISKGFPLIKFIPKSDSGPRDDRFAHTVHQDHGRSPAARSVTAKRLI